MPSECWTSQACSPSLPLSIACANAVTQPPAAEHVVLGELEDVDEEESEDVDEEWHSEELEPPEDHLQQPPWPAQARHEENVLAHALGQLVNGELPL
jgi:hypothetical protein